MQCDWNVGYTEIVTIVCSYWRAMYALKKFQQSKIFEVIEIEKQKYKKVIKTS